VYLRAFPLLVRGAPGVVRTLTGNRTGPSLDAASSGTVPKKEITMVDAPLYVSYTIVPDPTLPENTFRFSVTAPSGDPREYTCNLFNSAGTEVNNDRQQADNDYRAAEVDRLRQALSIVDGGNSVGANLYQRLFPVPQIINQIDHAAINSPQGSTKAVSS
jgi:hypothetical protein